MGLWPLEIFLILQFGDRLQSSESDVYRRLIRTSKVDPRTVRVQHTFRSQILCFNLLIKQIALQVLM